MSAINRTQVFSAVHTVGGLLPADMLVRISEGKDVDGSRPADYGAIVSRSVQDEAERHWDYLRSVWTELRKHLPVAPEAEVPVDVTGSAIMRWLLPLFVELGFGALTALGAGGIEADDTGKTFPVSHRWTHVPVHLTAWHDTLDKRVAGSVPAQSQLQECLNRTEAHLWGIVSNGRQLRLLRDSSALATSAYVEFDLEAIFDGELVSEFVLLYRLLHVSRFAVADGAAPASCWLERWRGEAVTSGARALDQLRDAVQKAITTLGTGFLRHPDNAVLREHVDTAGLHAALLRLVYRLLFVFVAEDRDVLHDPGASEQARSRYTAYFSTARLRAHALRRRGTAHADLYAALQIVLDALGDEHGRPELGLPGLGGIFDPAPADECLRGMKLANEHLLEAVRHLARVRDAGSRRWRSVDYRHLDAEELGSIYESLLELVPRHSAVDLTFELVAAAGNARKTTGSYYTPSALIELLLDSALDPVIDDAVKRGEQAAAGSPDPSEAIVGELLALTVCDPACGSGHFLVAAARRIAKRLAAVREGNPEPTLPSVRAALHDVIARCIYGVDLNPMAVELAKVSLWLEALEPGKPLSFLDPHVKCGNALVGATAELLRGGIPSAAFTAVEGDDTIVVRILLAKNARERDGQLGMFDLDNEVKISSGAFAAGRLRIAAAPSGTLAEVRRQRAAYRDFTTSAEYTRARHIADAWCAAFFWQKTSDAPPAVTEEAFRGLQDPAVAAVSERTHDEIRRIAESFQFFHWHLEFPEVFTTAKGGFSSIIGNPPWDTLSPDEKEFFARYDSGVRAMSKATRQERISELLRSSDVRNRWAASRRNSYALAHFVKRSGRYRLFAPGNLGKGDFNVYRMFVESALQLTAPRGAAAQITPSGLYNGANAQAIRKELFERWDLQLMLGFMNTRQEWFNGAHPMMQFALYSARKTGCTRNFRTGFGIANPAELTAVMTSPLRLSVDVVRSQSPDVLAISDSMGGGGADAEITDLLYRKWPMYGAASDEFPAGRYQSEIHMGGDRDRFIESGAGLPLYEGRMLAQFDHRAKAYVSGRGRSAVWRDLVFGAPDKGIVPQWFIPEADVPAKARRRVKRFRVGFCDVASPQNERSLVAALIPPSVVCGHTVPTILYPDDAEWVYVLWLGVANSVCLDFLARKKVALHMGLNVVDSLPFPRLTPGDPLLDRLARWGWSQPVEAIELARRSVKTSAGVR